MGHIDTQPFKFHGIGYFYQTFFCFSLLGYSKENNTKIVQYVKKASNLWSTVRTLYALSYCNRTQLMQPFSMTSLTVACLFSCGGITGQFFIAVFLKISIPKRKNSTKRENEIFGIQSAYGSRKIKHSNILKLLLCMHTGFLPNLNGL